MPKANNSQQNDKEVSTLPSGKQNHSSQIYISSKVNSTRGRNE